MCKGSVGERPHEGVDARAYSARETANTTGPMTNDTLSTRPPRIAARVARALVDGPTRRDWSDDAPVVAITHRREGSRLVVTVAPNERHFASARVASTDLWAALETAGEAAASLLYSLALDPDGRLTFEGSIRTSMLVDALDPRPRGATRAAKRATLWVAMNLLDAVIVRDTSARRELRPFTITTVTRHRRHLVPLEVGYRITLDGWTTAS